MPISDTTTLYEILLRFDDEGALQGAHVQRRRRVVLTATGETLKDEVLPAEPLDLDGAALAEFVAAVSV